MPTSTLRLIAVTVLFAGFAGYSLVQAYPEGSFFPPDGPPPTHNVAAPINTGDTYQFKLGSLGAVTMRAGSYCGADGQNCNLTVGPTNGLVGDVTISDAGPDLLLNDTDEMNVWLHANNDAFYVLGDRNESGNWNDDGNEYPLKMHIGTTANDDYAQFSNEVRANTFAAVGQVRSDQFCTADGSKCATLDELLADKNTNPDPDGLVTITGSNQGGYSWPGWTSSQGTRHDAISYSDVLMPKVFETQPVVVVNGAAGAVNITKNAFTVPEGGSFTWSATGKLAVGKVCKIKLTSRIKVANKDVDRTTSRTAYELQGRTIRLVSHADTDSWGGAAQCRNVDNYSYTYNGDKPGYNTWYCDSYVGDISTISDDDEQSMVVDVGATKTSRDYTYHPDNNYYAAITATVESCQ